MHLLDKPLEHLIGMELLDHVGDAEVSPNANFPFCRVVVLFSHVTDAIADSLQNWNYTVRCSTTDRTLEKHFHRDMVPQ